MLIPATVRFLFGALLSTLRLVLSRVVREALKTTTSPAQMLALLPGLVSPTFSPAGSAAATVAASAAAQRRRRGMAIPPR